MKILKYKMHMCLGYSKYDQGMYVNENFVKK